MKRTSCKLRIIAGSFAALLSVITPAFAFADCQADLNRARSASEKDAETMTISEANRAASAWDKVTASCPTEISFLATGMVGLYRCLSGCLYAEEVSGGKEYTDSDLTRAASAWESAAAMCTGDISREAAENAGIYRCAAEWNRAADFEEADNTEAAAMAWAKVAATCTGADAREARCNADYNYAMALLEKMEDGTAKDDSGKLAEAWEKATVSCTGKKPEGAGIVKGLKQTPI
ncbi:hypothetical protein LPW11_18265 [Geomonas sp. RF6]|uniref:hypothetical protein n=1 Tax=Geomonas sp. RF6 TaxID=2897342 RepID=UPI001E2A7BD4|nr:hypothetical protein [Geomonas sp. RF6]UFS69821.1 hypothetical protein LPW11_18265 [Geomonas sp. RF6]